MKTYHGKCDRDFGEVTVDGIPLKPRLDIRRHSPDGFAWGYSGSGPAQLALAILCDHLQDEEEACRWYQRFKNSVFVSIPMTESWTLTSDDVQRVLDLIRTRDVVES